MELNYEKPIFVYYLNVDGMSSQRAVETGINMQQMFSQYEDLVMWIIPVKDQNTRIDCIWGGESHNKDIELNRLIGEINERVDVLTKSNGNFDDFKIAMRDFRINRIINGETKD